MKLSQLLEGLEALEVAGSTSLEIKGVCYHTRQVHPASLFVAVTGEKQDGNLYVAQAVASGATAVVSEKSPPAGAERQNLTWIRVGSARRALAQIAANFYGHPSQRLRVVGVTGTNGKTTTTYLLQSILRRDSLRSSPESSPPVGLFGTVEYHTATGIQPAENTTPESCDLQRFLAELCNAGASWVVMEVSSHGLALDRVYGCRFEAGVFTNLARDHLDFHQTMDNYFEAKKRLFLGLGTEPPRVAVLNGDDPRSEQLRSVHRGPVVLFSLEGKPGAILAQQPTLSFSGTEFTLATPVGTVPIRSSLLGRGNLANLLAAAGTAFALGVSLECIAGGIQSLSRVPGRFERIDSGQPFAVVVDFAHTDLAFTRLLETARELTPAGRVIIVFGSGGDRDRSKRPVMGEIAGRLADQVILTTDNPRSEDPVEIINDILVGVQRVGGNYSVEIDRERAFAKAFASARRGDIVLLAGKGHQNTQIFRDRTEAWSDAEVARRLLGREGFRPRARRAANPAVTNAS